MIHLFNDVKKIFKFILPLDILYGKYQFPNNLIILNEAFLPVKF